MATTAGADAGAPPAHIALPERPAHADSSASRAKSQIKSAAKKAVGYDNVEANRIGVPVVSVRDYLSDNFHSPGQKAYEYLDSLFPFTKWILSYNTSWLLGDFIAGLTVGLVVVPQSMSYAIVATLKPEYGLYSSFVGVMVYAIFATSKDVTIGPVAVMSLQTANVIRHVVARVGRTKYTPEAIASALAFICGIVVLGIGLIRIGWIVEFIPLPAVAGFMTGSAFTIIAGQVPKLMGLTAVKTNGPAAYEVVIDTLKQLPNTKIDAAFGLTALFFLYAVRWLCNWLPRRYPGRRVLARTCFFVSVFRSAFTIIILTLASWLWLRNRDPKKTYPISILKTVPSGLRHIGAPNLDASLLADIAPEVPVSTVVLLLEHIAIAKSFGRLNNYKINPDQELIAMGVTNLVGPCFGGYAATGSFSRTAIKSKSGVRTPLAGWITGAVVIIALYAVTPAFFWLPNAGLAAVIIHAVTDLMAPLSMSYRFWAVNPLELVIFLAAVFFSIFFTLEIGIYVSVGSSLLLLLIRVARPRGRWLGTVTISHADGLPPRDVDAASQRVTSEVFVPLDDKDGLRDPSINVEPPPPGVLIYRFEEALTYPNASHVVDVILDKVKQETRPGNGGLYKKRGDRPWNDPGPINPYLAKALGGLRRVGKKSGGVLDGGNASVAPIDTRPVLRAILLDFGSVGNVDTTSVQNLVDLREAVERYADAKIEFHFANILSPWIRRALLAGGFGTGRASKFITELAPVISPREGLSAEELERREAEERARRQRAIDRAIKEGRQHQIYGVGVRTEKRQAHELEAAGGGSSPGDEKDAAVAGGGDALYATPEFGETAVVPRLGARGAASPDSTSSEGRRDKLSDDDEIDDDDEGGAPTRVGSGVSVASVPVVWGSDLTPFFHLTLNSALASVRD